LPSCKNSFRGVTHFTAKMPQRIAHSGLGKYPC
jgi:hypothetical protein